MYILIFLLIIFEFKTRTAGKKIPYSITILGRISAGMARYTLARIMLKMHAYTIHIAWICLFDAWKKFQTYSPKCWFDGDLPLVQSKKPPQTNPSTERVINLKTNKFDMFIAKQTAKRQI